MKTYLVLLIAAATLALSLSLSVQAQTPIVPIPLTTTPSFYLSQVTNATATNYFGGILAVQECDSVLVWLETNDSVAVTALKIIRCNPSLAPLDTLQLIGSFTNTTSGLKATYASVPVDGKHTFIQPYVTAALTLAQTSNNSKVRAWFIRRNKR